ncbi:hypothetical protein BHE74_00059715 [Ensete ventricosum]|nr:hypothetical protein BHE74_00059715 [Ensete ventricosum]
MSLELYVIVIGLISFILSGERADKTGGVYNVKDYGAAGDGQTDNTKVDFSCHGISIGSLGKNVGEKDVIGVKDPSLVKITDIKYRNITGTYVSQVAYKLVCSEAAPCEGVELSDISLEYNGKDEQAKNASICVNVYGSSNGNVEPKPCI